MLKHKSYDVFLTKYPKTRPPLSKEEEELYQKEYFNNRSGATFWTKIAQFLESWMHRKIAKSAKPNQKILEIGAGTLNQIPYETNSIDLMHYDIIEPQTYLFEHSPFRKYVRQIFRDINEISLNQDYDRIISVAVLEHLTHLPTIIAQCGLMLNENGVFNHGIPNEGGFLWGIAWRFTTGLSYKRRTGFSYKNLMKHEHVNSSKDILECLNYFFEKVEVKRFPTCLNHFSLYLCISCQNPKRKLCKEFLSQAINS